jgi:hypothetical protein
MLRESRNGNSLTGTRLLKLHPITLAGGAPAVEVARLIWLDQITKRKFRWSAFVGCCVVLSVLMHIDQPNRPPAGNHAHVEKSQLQT